MNQGLKTIIFPVRDLAVAKKVFGSLLGTEPYVDEPYYAGFRLEGQEVGLDPNGHAQGLSGPVCYWHVDDIAKSLGQLVDAGARTRQEPKDVGGGRLIATIEDPDGNVIGLLQDP
jgi:predicted enzyme related to lactoylglutathione lyase